MVVPNMIDFELPTAPPPSHSLSSQETEQADVDLSEDDRVPLD